MTTYGTLENTAVKSVCPSFLCNFILPEVLRKGRIELSNFSFDKIVWASITSKNLVMSRLPLTCPGKDQMTSVIGGTRVVIFEELSSNP